MSRRTHIILFTMLCLAVIAVAAVLADRATSEDRMTALPHTYVYRQSDQAVKSGRTTAVVFRPVKIGGKKWGFYDPRTPQYLRSPGNYIYAVTAQVTFQADPRGTRVLIIQENNGRTGWQTRAVHRMDAPSRGRAEMALTTQFAVDPGDRVRVLVRQTSGRTLRLIDTTHSPKLMMTALKEQDK